MQYVFGPVPSRRLGQSLGIDTIPLKTCNWNCVYCQLGRSKPLCNRRIDYIPINEILSQLKDALESHEPKEIDWITYVGSGEPTLHAGIGYLIEQVKGLTDIPVAVITNGSLLFLKSVRKALAAANAVLPSLDAGTPELYKKINRPHPDIAFDKYIEGMVQFRRGFAGEYWLEVMLVQGINDTREALLDIAKWIDDIQPDKVHIALPTRPPAEKWVRPPDQEGIIRAISILGDVARVAPPTAGKFELGKQENIVDTIISIITRHPMSEKQLQSALSIFPLKKQIEVINTLKASNQAQVIERFGQRFWCASPAVFPDQAK